MPNDPAYVREKLYQAVHNLATGAGRVQERLKAAAIDLIVAHPEDLPYENLRRVFAGVKDDLHFEPAKASEGSIAATMRITNNEDASAIARRASD